MFTRYWRSYPPFLQLLLFMLMMFTIFWFAMLLLRIGLPALTGYNAAQVSGLSSTAPPAQIRAALLAQAFSSLMVFAVPPLLFAQVTTPHRAEFLGLQRPRRPLHLLLATGLLLGLMPAMLAGQAWLEETKLFGSGADAAQEQAQAVRATMLGLRSKGDLLMALLTFALLPAVGEELLFRGILMRFAQRTTHRIATSLALSAFVFTALHPTPYGMPFIFVSGLLLGGMYWITGSLWAGMAAHFCWNGLQVLLLRLPGQASFVAGGKVPPLYLAGGLLLSLLCGWALWRSRSPLPGNWPQDYRPNEEPEAPGPGRIF